MQKKKAKDVFQMRQNFQARQIELIFLDLMPIELF
jgi:hypothetical protein